MNHRQSKSGIHEDMCSKSTSSRKLIMLNKLGFIIGNFILKIYFYNDLPFFRKYFHSVTGIYLYSVENEK